MLVAWPFYLVGVVLALVGFVALRRAIAELQGERPSTGPVALLACLLAFALGGSVIVVAMGIDSNESQVENTRTFSLHISVVPELPSPFSLSLPAPVDTRVQGYLSRTNGSSTMRLAGTAPAQYLRIDGSGNVSFDVEVTVVDSALDRTLTRVSLGPPSDGTMAASASIGLQASGNVDVTFSVRYSEFCAVTTYAVDAVVADGGGVYAGLWTVLSFDCPPGV